MIYIKEFLPNPVGKDKGGEYIKLFNDSEEAVDLRGWKIRDASGKIYSLNGLSIGGRNELILTDLTTKLVLNNDGETLLLYDSTNNLVDELGYAGKSIEGMVFSRNIVLTSELKEKLFENLSADNLSSLRQLQNHGSFLVSLTLAALIFASVSVYILREMSAD